MSDISLCATSSADAPGNPKEKVKTAIIGIGRMGLTHLAILGGHPFLKITAASDGASLITHGIAKYRSDIKLYENFQQMLEREELDAVLIATPPDSHGLMIDAALNLDLSIFVEKPFTLNAAEALRYAQRSENQKTAFHQVGYVCRHTDVYLKVKQLIQSNLLGRIISFQSEMHGCTVVKKENGAGWRGERKTGGGCLNEFGSHAVDMTVNLFGKPSKVVGSCLLPIYSERVEDLVRSTLIYENGVTGSLYANWSDPSHRKPVLKMDILGDQGRIQADFYGMKIFMNRENGSYKKGWNTINLPDLTAPVPFYVRGNEFTRQLYAFAEGVLHPGSPNLCSFRDGAATQEVIDMIFADANVVNP
jgi:predicted dehydrogenase